MDWGEAVNLVRVLRADPSSMLTAAMEGWDYPVSREWAVLADALDVQLAVNSGKQRPKPYPRPWKVKTERERMGDVGNRSPDEVKALLARARGGAPI